MDATKKHLLGILPGTLLLHASLAQADAGFATYDIIPIDNTADAVVVADLNNDGRDDIVFATRNENNPYEGKKIEIFYQFEQGGLSGPYPIHWDMAATTPRPTSIAVGDFNNDTLLDVAAALDEGYIAIFTQGPDGLLSQTDTIGTPYTTQITAADLNADGLDDIAGITWGGQDAAIFYQSATGVTHQPTLFFAPHGGYDDLAAGDINGDGADDLVVMSGQGYAYDNLAILTSDGQGGLNPVAFYDIGGNELSRGVTIGDLNQDGRNDVAVTFGGNRPNANIAAFHQLPDGSLGTPVIRASHDIPETITAADINNDLRDDLLVLHGGWRTLGAYEQSAEGSLLPEQLFDIPYSSHYNPQSLAVGDINGDNLPDAVIADKWGLVTLTGTIGAELRAPVADAGTNLLASQTQLVALDGQGSYDSDGNIQSYQWLQLAGTPVQIVNASSSSASFTAPLLPAGQADTLTFELRVTDNDGLSGVDWVLVTVAADQAPVANAGGDAAAIQNTLATLDGSASFDTEGPITSYQWTQISGPTTPLTNPLAPQTSLIVPILAAGESAVLVYELTVTDVLGNIGTDSATISIAPNNTPIAAAGSDWTARHNTLVTLDGSASADTDGTITRYHWQQIAGPAVTLSGIDSPIATFMAPKLRRTKQVDLTFELTVTDNLGASTADTVTVTVSK